MNIFQRKNKSTPGSYYFGEFNDVPLAPFSVSIAKFDSDFTAEPKHYHTKNQKVYITISGSGILNVNGEKVKMSPDQMIQVEPNDIHFVESVSTAPLEFVVVLSSKTDDKVVIDE